MGIKLVAVRKDTGGQITHFLTNDHTVLTIQEAQLLAKDNKLDSLSELDADGSWCVEEAEGKTCGINLSGLPGF